MSKSGGVAVGRGGGGSPLTLPSSTVFITDSIPVSTVEISSNTDRYHNHIIPMYKDNNTNSIYILLRRSSSSSSSSSSCNQDDSSSSSITLTSLDSHELSSISYISNSSDLIKLIKRETRLKFLSLLQLDSSSSGSSSSSSSSSNSSSSNGSGSGGIDGSDSITRIDNSIMPMPNINHKMNNKSSLFTYIVCNNDDDILPPSLCLPNLLPVESLWVPLNVILSDNTTNYWYNKYQSNFDNNDNNDTNKENTNAISYLGMTISTDIIDIIRLNKDYLIRFQNCNINAPLEFTNDEINKFGEKESSSLSSSSDNNRTRNSKSLKKKIILPKCSNTLRKEFYSMLTSS